MTRFTPGLRGRWRPRRWVGPLREQVGLLYLVAGQASLVLLGYVTNVFVARSLGPEETGRFGVVMSILTWIEVLIIDGAPQALRRYVAMRPQSARTIVLATTPAQLRFALLVFAASFLSSPLLARALRDSSYTFLFQIAFLDVLLYAAYWYVNGVLHGLKRFGDLFWMITGYALGKCVLTIVLIGMGLRAEGALLANALASAVGAAVGMAFVSRAQLGLSEWSEAEEFWSFSRWNVVYGLLTSLLPSVDLWCVRYFGTDYQAGLYTVAGSIAKVPYFLALAFMSFALPSLASQVGEVLHDGAALRRHWRAVHTSALLTFLPMVLLVELFARPLIVILFGSAYLGALPILRILFPGTVLYSFLLLENTRVMAIHGMVPTLRTVALTTVVTVVAVVYGAYRAGALGAAMAFASAMALGYVLARRV
ncbi:MAG: oligosaccharide flippase family protein [candidate division KSB1 bacterium]|nr:oligosaccharide flippase family protein [candidate division KSB1 bacterium]